MDEEDKKVVKGITTVYPSGYRLARNGGAAVLEFLDDRDEHVEVIYSGAMNIDIVKDLIKSLEHFISVSEDNEK